MTLQKACARAQFGCEPRLSDGSLAQRSPFRTLITKALRRALQVADGYFEWLAPEHQRRGEPHQPFYFQVDGGETFAFAALWMPAKVAGPQRGVADLRGDEPGGGGDPRPHASDPRRRGGAASLA